jgi:small-conductance mechanosensitive channel
MDSFNALLERLSASLEDRAIVWNLFNTVALALTVLLARSVVLRSLKLRAESDPAEYRRLRALVRNVALVVMLIGAAVIWANELRTLALSLVAVAAAIVIATKELILCLSGALYRQSATLFRVGDRIEVNNVRGDVIESGLLSTTVLEVAPAHQLHAHTGRAVVIPNAFFLSHAVTNESFTSQFVLHTITLPVKSTVDLPAIERVLADAITAEIAPYLDDAKLHFQRAANEHGLEKPSIDPRVWIHIVDVDKVELIARFPVPVRRKGRIEQAVLRRVLPELTAPPSTTEQKRADA